MRPNTFFINARPENPGFQRLRIQTHFYERTVKPNHAAFSEFLQCSPPDFPDSPGTRGGYGSHKLSRVGRAQTTYGNTIRVILPCSVMHAVRCSGRAAATVASKAAEKKTRVHEQQDAYFTREIYALATRGRRIFYWLVAIVKIVGSLSAPAACSRWCACARRPACCDRMEM